MIRICVSDANSENLDDSLYLDSSIIVKCGLFYNFVVNGKIDISLSFLQKFNNAWAQNILKLMGYKNYSIAINLENELERLCLKCGKDSYKVTTQGISIILDEVFRFKKSKMEARDFMAIFDAMIKNKIHDRSSKNNIELLVKLQNAMIEEFGIKKTISFNTHYDNETLSVKLLSIIAEIYLKQSYYKKFSPILINKAIRNFEEYEKRFHNLLNETKDSEYFNSDEFLLMAEKIRSEKLNIYRMIYQADIAKTNINYLIQKNK